MRTPKGMVRARKNRGMNEAVRRFMATRRAWAKLIGAALELMSHIYTKKMCEKVAEHGDWLSEVVTDGEVVLKGQYELAGKP